MTPQPPPTKNPTPNGPRHFLPCNYNPIPTLISISIPARSVSPVSVSIPSTSPPPSPPTHAHPLSAPPSAPPPKVNRAWSGGFSAKTPFPLPLDRALLLLLAADDAAAELIREWCRSDFEGIGGCGGSGGAPAAGTGGWLLSGEGVGKRAVGEGRVRPTKDLVEVRERGVIGEGGGM
jgi:hypothetical protein